MNYILDTNVISELVKKRPDRQVVDWLVSFERKDNLYLSCLTIGEISAGILKLEKKDQVAAKALQTWLDKLLIDYEDNIIAIDLETCKQWAHLMTIDSSNAIDGLLAAQASQKNMTLVTRNSKHFEKFKVKLLNPFSIDHKGG